MWACGWVWCGAGGGMHNTKQHGEQPRHGIKRLAMKIQRLGSATENDSETVLRVSHALLTERLVLGALPLMPYPPQKKTKHNKNKTKNQPQTNPTYSGQGSSQEAQDATSHMLVPGEFGSRAGPGGGAASIHRSLSRLPARTAHTCCGLLPLDTRPVQSGSGGGLIGCWRGWEGGGG